MRQWILMSTALLATACAGSNPAAPIDFSLQLAETSPSAGLYEAADPVTGSKVWLHGTPLLTNADVERASVTRDEHGMSAVEIWVVESARPRFREATRNHMRKPIAIVVDGKVAVVAEIKSVLSSRFVIAGRYTPEEAAAVAAGITASRRP